MANLRLLTLKIRTENKIFLRPDFSKLVKTAKSYGWLVKSYKEAEFFIKHHNLEELTKRHRAFSYEYDKETIIFYRDSLEGEQLLLSIAHEIGHLILQHDEKNDAADDEADKFAMLLIGDYTYLSNITLIMIIFLVLAVMLTLKSCSKSNVVTNNDVPPVLQTETATIPETINSTQEQSEFETTLTTAIETFTNSEIKTEAATYIVDSEHAVYITKSGDKYHSADCYHINVDNCTMLSETQAVSLGYEPCKTCRPDVEAIQPDEYDPVEEYIDEPEPELDYFLDPKTELITNPPEIETTDAIQPIEINQATIEDFMTIPGIDEEKAVAILDLRDAIHGFQHPYEILYADGISREFLASILDYLYVDTTEVTT